MNPEPSIFSFRLEKKDFLEFMIHEELKTKYVTKFSPIIWALIGIIPLLIIVYYSIIDGVNTNLIVFVPILLAIVFFNRHITRFETKSKCKSHVKEAYKNKFDKLIKVWFQDSQIHIEDESWNGIIKTESIVHFDETKNLLLIENKDQGVLMIPRYKLDELNKFEKEWNEFKRVNNLIRYKC